MSTPSHNMPHISTKSTRTSAAKPTSMRVKLLMAALAAMLCLGLAGCGLFEDTLGSSPSKETPATTQTQAGQDESNDESTVALSAEDLAAAEDRDEAGLAEDETMDDPSAGNETEPTEITLVAVGDSLIHEEVFKAQKTSKGYNFDSLFKHVKKDIKNADIAVINQETIFVKSGYSGYPCFGSPMALGNSIVKAGFDVVQHATNHTMDRGESAVRATLKYWKKHPEVKVLGIHANKKAAKKITVMERNGIKVAMLNYTYGTNGIPVPSDAPYLVDRLKNKKKIAHDIKRAKAQSDFVVVFAHFGTEYRYKPDGSQRMWAKWFAKQGVDLLVGTHPHVLEPVKYIKGKNGHKMLCYYSLGNFVSCQSTMDTMLGGMAKVKIKKDEEGARIANYDLIPLVTQMGGGGKKYTVYKLSKYTPALAQSNPIRGIVGGEFTVKNLKKLYKEITGRKA